MLAEVATDYPTRLSELICTIVPTVYRDDYFSALHALSQSVVDEPTHSRIEPCVAALNRAAGFSHTLDCSGVRQLEISNASKHPSQGRLTLPKALPAI